jgi:hypothetical protein
MVVKAILPGGFAPQPFIYLGLFPKDVSRPKGSVERSVLNRLGDVFGL